MENRLAYYDDQNYSYLAFWHGREYEHEAELMALRTLLGPRKFKVAVDVGGGFGRLVSFLSRYARKVVLIEPSEIQRVIAHQHTSNSVEVLNGSSHTTGLPDEFCDLAVMVRVMHHMPETKGSIAEIRRILKPGGLFVLEFANSLHVKSRLKRGVRFKSTPREPVRVDGTGDAQVPFVNHHPQSIYDTLTFQGFVIEKTLSVSNMRSPLLKKLLPRSVLLLFERLTQRAFAPIHFGPSIFILARRP